MLAHHSEPPTLWPHGMPMQLPPPSEASDVHSKLPTIAAENMEKLTRNDMNPHSASTITSTGNSFPPPYHSMPVGAMVHGSESQSVSVSCTPPPPLVLGAAHLAHSFPHHSPSISGARSSYGGSRPSSAASNTGRTLTPQGRVEISIVGSPEVFGVGPTASSAPSMLEKHSEDNAADVMSKHSPPVLTIDEDERVIERCEQVPPMVESRVVGQPRNIGSIVQGTSLNNSLCLPTTGHGSQDIGIAPLSPGPNEDLAAQEGRPASNCSKQSVTSSSTSPGAASESTVKRRGSFSTGSQPPPKKRFVLSLSQSDESKPDDSDLPSQTQVHDGRVDRGVGSDDPEIVVDDVQEPVPKRTRPDSTDTVAYEYRPYCPKTQDAQTSTTVQTTPQDGKATPVSIASPRSDSSTTVPTYPAPGLMRIGNGCADPRFESMKRGFMQNGPVPLQPNLPSIRSALESPSRHQHWSGLPVSQSARLVGPLPTGYQTHSTVGLSRPVRPVRPQASFAQHTHNQHRMNGIPSHPPKPIQPQPQPQPHQVPSQAVGASHGSAGGGNVNTGDGNSLTHYRLIQEIKQLPHGEQFQAALNNWEWVLLDSVRLPSVYRGNSEKFVAVHMVQMRLLSKFPPNVPGEIMRRHTMVSHKMTVLESWIFNTVNALQCRFEFGCQLFTTQDEVVKLADVEKFYWAVKAFNLSRMSEIYRTEIRGTAQLHLVLTAHISSLKSHAEQELRDVQQVIASGSSTIVGVGSPMPPSRSNSRVHHSSPVGTGHQGPVTIPHNTAAAMAAQSALLTSHYAQAAAARAGQNVSILPQHSVTSGVNVSHAHAHAHQLYPSPLTGESVSHGSHNPHLLAAAYVAAASGQYPTSGVTPGTQLLHSPTAGHHHSAHHPNAPAPSIMSPTGLRLQYGPALAGKPAAAAVPHVYR